VAGTHSAVVCRSLTGGGKSSREPQLADEEAAEALCELSARGTTQRPEPQAQAAFLRCTRRPSRRLPDMSPAPQCPSPAGRGGALQPVRAIPAARAATSRAPGSSSAGRSSGEGLNAHTGVGKGPLAGEPIQGLKLLTDTT
jgi:hypothetical protein